MTTTLANQLPRINSANGGSMQSAQVVTLKSGQQNASSIDSNRQCTHLSFVQAQHYRVALESRAIRKLNHNSETVRIRLWGLEAFMRWVVAEVDGNGYAVTGLAGPPAPPRVSKARPRPSAGTRFVRRFVKAASVSYCTTIVRFVLWVRLAEPVANVPVTVKV